MDEKYVTRHEETNCHASIPNNDIDETSIYQQILNFMEKNETVSQTIRRIGKNRKQMSTVERLRNKKLGLADVGADKIMKLTEMVNNILTMTGNMDVYEMTYESIDNIVKLALGTSTASADLNLDIFSDGFTEREITIKNKFGHLKNDTDKGKLIHWEFKWSQEDTDLQGPYDTQEMLEMSKNGKLRNGVYVRRVGEKTHFYTSNRIDFELYL